MSVFNILNKETFTVNRRTAGEGRLDGRGNWIPSSTTTSITMTGSIQPYKQSDIKNGNISVPLPSGFDSEYARTVYTNQEVFVVNRQRQIEPDEIVIDGEVFFCFRVYNYLNGPLVDLRHCKAIFVRRDKLDPYQGEV